MSQITALASLTATYTDSEGEGDQYEDDDHHENQGTVTLNSPGGSGSDNKSSSGSRATSPVPVRITSKLAKLVSYLDDTAATDDENEADSSIPEHQIIMLMENDQPKSDTLDSVDEEGVYIPPEPTGHCSLDLQDKMLKLYEKMQSQQLDMNAVIQKRKDFRNPSIYEKLITYCSINELGTNYPPSIYDPQKWSKESYYEELSKVQKVEMDKREKERKSKVEFISGTKKQEEDAKKRKSKWDQPAGNSVGSQGIKPAGLVQPSLTNSATGTKGTVISAFGSLPKKPRQ